MPQNKYGATALRRRLRTLANKNYTDLQNTQIQLEEQRNAKPRLGTDTVTWLQDDVIIQTGCLNRGATQATINWQTLLLVAPLTATKAKTCRKAKGTISSLSDGNIHS